MDSQTFALGWSPESAAAAAARTTYAKTGFRSDTPIPPAYSLTQYRRRPLYQGQAGTCWVHAATRLAETILVAEGLFEYAELCRCLIGYEGKKLEGGGNPDDGGNVTDSLTAMRAKPNGIGTCHESVWPYKDERRYLGQRPPAAALADIGFFLDEVADVAGDTAAEADAAARVNIAHGFGNAQGIWWPYAFDDASKATDGCLFHGYGAGTFGHALYECGYVQAGVWPGDLGKYAWWQLDNWHGELYAPLPVALAALVPGYRPTSTDKTTDFWVRDDVYATLIHGKNAERVTASGTTGWKKLTPPSSLEDALGQL